MNLVSIFEDMPDFRVDRNKHHRLVDIMVIAVTAFICGADGWTEVEDFGESKQSWFARFLELPNGVPSHDTFCRVFRLLNPLHFERCFLRWIESIQHQTQGEIIAIDGKTLRRSYNTAKGKPAVHMVSAWANANGLVLGQIKTEEKSNEITAIPELLSKLALGGCIVTIDAMGCQKTIATQIQEQEADYVLALKGNQGHLHDDVKTYLDHAISHKRPLSYHEEVDTGHGRIETRRCWVTEKIDWLEPKGLWTGLRSICAIECERIVGEKVSCERRYFISSLAADASVLANAVRAHWSIENNLHWVLDVVFKEDYCRAREGYAAQNMAVLRHMALNLLKKENSRKRSIKTKRLKAGWDEAFLLAVLGF